MLTQRAVLGIFVLLSAWVSMAPCYNFTENRAARRQERVLNLFTVLRFSNEACQGTSKNGTCYTSAECSQKGGSSSGSCAGGFGVCCIFSQGCGSRSSENCTYFTKSAFTSTTTNPCTFTVCKCDSSVCRFRLDFDTFVIANPVVTTVAATTSGNTIGDCLTDHFVATSPGNRGTPLICGYNTGQHVYLDATDACSELSFDIAATDTTTSRSFDIKITQYECGHEKAGPPDCLQYFTSSTGTIASFNFRTDQTTTSTTATHLSEQCYSACFRRNANQCKICFYPVITAADPNSFGLSVAAITITQSQIDANCGTDYIVISGAQAAAPTNSLTGSNVMRLCGRYFAAADGGTAATSVCSLQTPFRLDVKFDETEAVAATGQTQANTENNGAPSGNTGFYLGFTQSTQCA